MTTVSYETCPTSAPFFGFMGVTAALCFASMTNISLHSSSSSTSLYISVVVD